MKKYLITICNVSYGQVTVEAESEEQACELAWDQWDGETESASNDITDVEEI